MRNSVSFGHLNLMDEARRHGLQIDERRLSKDLGVPVVPTSARFGEGLPQLLQAISEVANGQVVPKPHRIRSRKPGLKRAIQKLVVKLESVFPSLPNARWVALRLLDGDQRIREALKKGDLGKLSPQSTFSVVESSHERSTHIVE